MTLTDQINGNKDRPNRHMQLAENSIKLIICLTALMISTKNPTTSLWLGDVLSAVQRSLCISHLKTQKLHSLCIF